MPLPRSITSSTHQEFDLSLVRGDWPASLAGEIYFSAIGEPCGSPSVLFRNGEIKRLSLTPGTHGAAPGKFAWRRAALATPSARVRARRPELFALRYSALASPLGGLNMANTAPLVWGDRLFVTWDAGRPVELDPIDLGFIAEVGHKGDWTSVLPSPLFPMAMTTAHPVVDHERDCLWTVNLAIDIGERISWRPSVVRYSGRGDRIEAWPIRGAVIGGSVHTISQTRDWLIVAESGNFKSDMGEMMGGERSVLADLATPVYLIRKDLLLETPPGREVAATRCELSPPTSHYYGVWDDRQGVRVIFEHMENLDLGFHLRADDTDLRGRPIDPSQLGMYSMQMSPATLTEVELDPRSGRVMERARFHEDRHWNGALSAIDWSPRGLAQPTRHHMVFFGHRPENICQRALACYRSRIDPKKIPHEEIPSSLVTFERGALTPRGEHWYPVDEFPTSPTFVPRADGGGQPGGHEGFVIVPVLSDGGFRVEVFDARRVEAGPVAVIQTRETVPFLIHSAWTPGARPAEELPRLRFGAEIDHAAESALEPDHLELARAVACEIDEENRARFAGNRRAANAVR
jgi:hypothetical protein